LESVLRIALGAELGTALRSKPGTQLGDKVGFVFVAVLGKEKWKSERNSNLELGVVLGSIFGKELGAPLVSRIGSILGSTFGSII